MTKTTKTTRKPRTLADLRSDPRVAEIWREDDGCFGDRASYWLALAPGLNWDGCSCLHEATVADLCERIGEVVEGAPY
jgi:hypothetical protein